MTERKFSPAVSPEPGDVVMSKDGALGRRCTKRVGGDVYYVRIVKGVEKDERICWITTWQDWCAKHGIASF